MSVIALDQAICLLAAKKQTVNGQQEIERAKDNLTEAAAGTHGWASFAPAQLFFDAIV